MSGTKPRRASGRQQLDRDVIVNAALELAGTGETVTFRALGTALGADPTAVYRHFRDKEELMASVVDRLIMTMQARIDPDVSWREQLRQGAIATMDAFAAHPRVGVEVPAIATGGVGELEAINWILTQLQRAGLERQQIIRFYAAYSSYVLAASAALSWQQLHDQARGPRSRWVGDLRAVDAAEHPVLAALLPDVLALSDREVYITGLDVFLDSIEHVAPNKASVAD